MKIDCNPTPYSGDATIKLNCNGKTISLKGHRLEVLLYVNDELTETKMFPPENVHLSKTNQDTLTTFRFSWNPDDEVKIKATLKDMQDEVSFTVPRPPKPHEDSYWMGDKWFIDPDWFKEDDDIEKPQTPDNK